MSEIMNRMIDVKIFLKLIRVNQWYKNIIIFLPLVFSLQFFSPDVILLSIFGFIALCLVSSAGYIRNDIKDLPLDLQHPKKKNRPLPAKKISIPKANIIFIGLIAAGLGLSFFLDWKFGIMTILLLVNTEVYSNWLKKYLFLDIFSISGNFLIRAISGVILIGSPLSPWLILGIFFVALFLAVIKRRNEVSVMADSAKNHREVLNQYTATTLNSIILISSIMVITTYSLYSMDSVTQDWRLVITVPIVVYIVFRQIHLSSISQEESVSDSILKDKSTGIAIIVYSVLTILLLYIAPSEFFMS